MSEIDSLKRQAHQLRNEAAEKIKQAEAIEKKVADAEKAIRDAQSVA